MYPMPRRWQAAPAHVDAEDVKPSGLGLKKPSSDLSIVLLPAPLGPRSPDRSLGEFLAVDVFQSLVLDVDDVTSAELRPFPVRSLHTKVEMGPDSWSRALQRYTRGTEYGFQTA